MHAPIATGQPKLRSDLVISRQDSFVVVKDPAAGRFFRLRDIEHFIASQFDGSTSLGEVRERTEQKFGAAPAPDVVEGFVAKLRRVGLLETMPAGPEASVRQAGGPRGDLLHLRLSAFDPDRLLDRLIGKVRLCFTPHFVGLSTLLIVVALGIAIRQRAEIARDLASLARFETVVPALLAIFLVAVVHEFAHGLTCKHFGGRVREMGFLLIYFQLAFYCNVSDAWLFPEKSKRLLVTLAGPYVELILWALAVLTWRFTGSAVWPHPLALVVVATAAVRLFINLNPLIRLDGYYLLSDAFGIPNLRARAFSYLSGCVRSRFARLQGSPARAVQAASPRERRIYFVYGLLAGGYSVWLLGSIAWALGNLFTGAYQGIGAILSAGLLAAVFQSRLRRLVSSSALAEPWRDRVAAAKRPAKLLIALAAMLAVLFFGRIELTVSGELTMRTRHNTDVRARTDGIVTEASVAEGQRVAQGDGIARVSDEDYRGELRAAEAQIEETGARLKMLRAGARPEQIEAAQAALARLQDGLDRLLEQFRAHGLDPVMAEITVPEKDIGDVRAGQPVVLEVRAFPAKSFVGRVAAIAPVAVKEGEGRGARSVVGVTTVVDDADRVLTPEMTGNAKIYCGERRIVDLLTRRRIVDVLTHRLARFLRVEVWSW